MKTLKQLKAELKAANKAAHAAEKAYDKAERAMKQKLDVLNGNILDAWKNVDNIEEELEMLAPLTKSEAKLLRKLQAKAKAAKSSR